MRHKSILRTLEDNEKSEFDDLHNDSYPFRSSNEYTDSSHRMYCMQHLLDPRTMDKRAK